MSKSLLIRLCCEEFDEHTQQLLGVVESFLVTELENSDVEEEDVDRVRDELEELLSKIEVDQAEELTKLDSACKEAIEKAFNERMDEIFPSSGGPASRTKTAVEELMDHFALGLSNCVTMYDPSRAQSASVVDLWADYWDKALREKAGKDEVDGMDTAGNAGDGGTGDGGAGSSKNIDGKYREGVKSAVSPLGSGLTLKGKTKDVVVSLCNDIVSEVDGVRKELNKERAKHQKVLRSTKTVDDALPLPRPFPDRGAATLEIPLSDRPPDERTLVTQLKPVALATFADEHTVYINRLREVSANFIELVLETSQVMLDKLQTFAEAYRSQPLAIDPVIMCSAPRVTSQLGRGSRFNFFLRGPSGDVLDGKPHIIFVLVGKHHEEAHRNFLFADEEAASHIFLVVIDDPALFGAPSGQSLQLSPGWYVETAKMVAEWLLREYKLKYYVRMTPNVLAAYEASDFIRMQHCSMARMLVGLRHFAAAFTSDSAEQPRVQYDQLYADMDTYSEDIESAPKEQRQLLHKEFRALRPLLDSCAKTLTARDRERFCPKLEEVAGMLKAIAPAFPGLPSSVVKCVSCSAASANQAYIKWLTRDDGTLKEMIDKDVHFNFDVLRPTKRTTTLGQTTVVLVDTATQSGVHAIKRDDFVNRPQPYDLELFYREFTKVEGTLAVQAARQSRAVCILTDHFSIRYYHDCAARVGEGADASNVVAVPVKPSTRQLPALLKQAVKSGVCMPLLHQNDMQLRALLEAETNRVIVLTFSVPADLLQYLADATNGGSWQALRERVFESAEEMPHMGDKKPATFFRDKYALPHKPLEFDFLHALGKSLKWRIEVLCCVQRKMRHVTCYALGERNNKRIVQLALFSNFRFASVRAIDEAAECTVAPVSAPMDTDPDEGTAALAVAGAAMATTRVASSRKRKAGSATSPMSGKAPRKKRRTEMEDEEDD